jgi:5-hydroxyisourate hydrolase
VSAITTHALDTSAGRPAAGLKVRLEVERDGAWRTVGEAVTGADGRAREFSPPTTRLEAGSYRLVFDTAAYFASRGVESFYPVVAVTFAVRNPEEHYHVPLLLSPFGYSTYRGS